MAEISVIIRTADQTRKAEVAMEDSSAAKDVIDGAVSNWTLPTDTDYSLVNTSNGKTITPSMTLADAGVKSGEILEIQPVLVAG
jgi:hypothetical protein